LVGHALVPHYLYCILLEVPDDGYIFALSGVHLSNSLVLGEFLNSRPRNLASRHQKHPSIVWCVFQYLEPFIIRGGSQVWRTDGQTEPL